MKNSIKREDMERYFGGGVAEKKVSTKKRSANAKKIGVNDMIGLKSFKEIYDTLSKRFCVEKVLSEKGFSSANGLGTKTFMFVGNPGTAKTTVAKMIGEDLKEKGILSKGHIVFAGRKNIIGRYAGDSTKNVQEVFRKAKGGVLFIDEAYSLVEKWADGGKGYGGEVIDTIVEALGSPESDMVVIFAGYPKEMEEFIEANPGIKSRVTYKIRFDDYSEEELYEILKLHAEKGNFKLTGGVKKYLLPKLKKAREASYFGNGRFVVNLLERAITNQRVRLYNEGSLESITESRAATLCKNDFEGIDSMINEMGKSPEEKRKVVGFKMDNSEKEDDNG